MKAVQKVSFASALSRRGNRTILRVEAHHSALQAIFSSMSASSPSRNSNSGEQLSKEQAAALSSKLDELFGQDVASEALARAGQIQRNEKGEVCVSVC